ncbi:polysaccharide deacetylase family protein [Paenibacillus glycanilyticus]|uniref:polysaccharide deacetylase family protein n=1 Tax=Paenibacillus glycanilyticus TaxID=126569 RepID=UPI00203A97A5|nr:polysaccharide deacetylase family protein [Paenibacillus glycanilyticus]MCM3630893.1 polysaccharide deacetylase family protein [Paenibacillus glycanilyticus]
MDNLIVQGDPDQGLCAFTFDDGPHRYPIELWLDILEQGGATGTFFFTGEWIDRHPDQVRTILARGHVLAPHSYHHRRMAQIPRHVFFEELKLTELAYQDAAGQPCPAFMRFPYRSFMPENLAWLAEWGYTNVEGEDSGDWAGISAESIVLRIEPLLRSGTIVVQHCNDIALGTPAALKILLRKAHERGLDPVGIPEMLKALGRKISFRAWKLVIDVPAEPDYPADNWEPVSSDEALLRLAHESADWRAPQFTFAHTRERDWYEHLRTPLNWGAITEKRELLSARRFMDAYWGYVRAGVDGDKLVLMDYDAKEAQADTLVYLLRWAVQTAKRFGCVRIEAVRDIRRMSEMCRQLGFKSELVPDSEAALRFGVR